MKLPILGGSDSEARVQPEDHYAYLVERGKGLHHVPELGVILFFQGGVFRMIRERHSLTSVDPFRPKMHLMKTPKGHIGLMSDFGMGGPATTVLMEILIAAGVTRFVFIGSAGALQPVGAGEIVLCEEAIRDEGVSYHYLPADEDVKASSKLLKSWGEALENQDVGYRVGMSWTTDAPFRELKSHVETFKSQGIQCVEMEAASIYAVAQFRSVEAVCGFAISDSVGEAGWKPQFHYAPTKEGQYSLFKAAVECLSS
jgi:uridine phosphorylase